MKGPDPRNTAYQILNELDSETTTLDLLISEKFDPMFEEMPRRDRNLAYALVYGVLRTRNSLDWIIRQFAKRKTQETDPRVLNILRIALYQVFHMTRIPQSAAVNTAVELAKQSFSPWVVRFVNGMLRAVTRGMDGITWPERDADPLLWLCVTHSFPKWLLKRWIGRYGFDETDRLCAYLNTPPPLSLRTNTLRITRDRLIAQLLPHAKKVAPAPHVPEGILVYGLKCTIMELHAFQNGFFQVQDEAAQLVSHIVNPGAGETVLDACAGLGGKTGHMAQLMMNKGRVIAIDTHAGRLAKSEEQMRRLGIDTVSFLKHDISRDLNDILDPEYPLMYDRVLLDAPCSGVGVIRRNPDTRWSAKPEAFARYGKNQLNYLENIASYVKPGGTLVYAVCSIEPEETIDVVCGFLEAHSGYRPEPVSGEIATEFPGMSEKPGFITSIPHIHNMDGFFIAALKKGG